MKNASLFTVPVINGAAVYPKAELKALLKGTGYGLRLFGRNPNRKQFAKDSFEHDALRQNPPVRIGTTAVVYLRSYADMNYDTGELHRTAISETAAKKLIKAKFPNLFRK